MSPQVTAFVVGSVAGWVVVVGAARARRGGLYARFAGVFLGVHSLVAWGVVGHVGALFPAFAVLQGIVLVHFLFLSQPRMRPFAYRLVVSVPASFFVAGTLLALPWVLVGLFFGHLYGLWIPYALSAIGVYQSFTLRRDLVDLVIDRAEAGALGRHATGSEPAAAEGEARRALRLVQITDPHLGPFMSVARLRSICERAVAQKPDLVLLTGDFLTMESQETDAHLTTALEPLRALPGRVFACRGNHDHEAPELVARALASVGATLLVDEAQVVETPVGPVQIVGMDFHFARRPERMSAVCEANPRVPGAFRLVLLHDPGAFQKLPEGEGDLVLSGHTHGGQLGLVSLGLHHTILRAFVDMPDHGFWARGRDRLYVHRGTGHYGFPLRLGVPAEESVLRVHLGA